MLEVRAVAAIGCYGRPLIVKNPCSGTSRVHHRFDCQNHAFAQTRTVSASAVIRNLRLLVQPCPDSVSDKFPDDAESVGFDKFLYGSAYISDCIADPRRFEILQHIASEDEVACSALKEGQDVSAATLSHHIKELEAAGLVEIRRESKFLYMQLRRPVWKAYLKELKNIGS